MIVNINLNSGEVKQLTIYEGQQNSDAVFDFCRQNGLDQVSYGEILRQVDESQITPVKSMVQIQNMPTQQQQQDFSQNNHTFVDDDDQIYDELGIYKPKDVYDRLYSKAILKQRQQQEIQNTEKKHNNQKLQDYWAQNKLPPGERLYKFCQKKQEEKEYQISKMKKVEDSERKQENTFRPQINPNSQILVQQMGYTNKEDNFVRLTKNKKSYVKDEQDQSTQQNVAHTFIPQISEISNQLATFMRQAREFDNVYDQLYYQGTIKKKKANKNEKIPDIQFNPIANKTSKSFQSHSFLERVRMDLDKKKQKIDFMRLQNHNLDMKTGQQLYNPKIGRAPKGVTTVKERDVFQDLYEQATTLTQKINQLKDDERKELETMMVKCNEKSEDMAFENRKQSIRNVFFALDKDDQDGLVRCSGSEINNLPLKIQNILQSVLHEICYDFPDGIEFEEFFEIVYRYTLQLPQSDKNTIYLNNRKKTRQVSTPECSFVPKINDNSRQMCKNKLEYAMCKCQVCKENSHLLSLLQNDTLG